MGGVASMLLKACHFPLPFTSISFFTHTTRLSHSWLAARRQEQGRKTAKKERARIRKT